jgi:hypothetical protein
MSRVVWLASLLASSSFHGPLAPARTASDDTQGVAVSGSAATHQAARCPAGPTTVRVTVGC